LPPRALYLPSEGPLDTPIHRNATGLKQVSIRNAPADIVRGDHDLNDTQWHLVVVCRLEKRPGILRNTSRQNQDRGVEIWTRSDYQAHAAGDILHIRTDFLDQVGNLTAQPRYLGNDGSSCFTSFRK